MLYVAEPFRVAEADYRRERLLAQLPRAARRDPSRSRALRWALRRARTRAVATT